MVKTAVAELATLPNLDPSILKLIEDQSKLIAEQSAKLAELELKLPQYRPIYHEDKASIAADRLSRFAEEGGEEGMVRSLPITSDGHTIPAEILKHLQPTFQVGQQVHIRASAHREGWPSGRTWGDLLQKYRTNGIGEIARRYFLSKLGVWKYRVVKVKGLTKPQVGDGFYEYELEAV